MAIMFDHAVKYNGKYYPANTPIEEIAPAVDEEKAEEKPETTKKAVKSRKKGDVK